MKDLGQEYFDLFRLMPLRTICTDDEFLAAEIVTAHLLEKAKKGTLTEDEGEYWYVLDLLITDYIDCLDEQELDEICEPEIADLPAADDPVDEASEEFAFLLEESHRELQEWDFAQLCKNLSIILSRKMSEMETG